MANSSAVCPMSWCCSVKSSGVKTSSPFRSARRKLPPEILLVGIAVVAISNPFLTTEATEEHRGIISFRPIFAIYHSLDAITKVCDTDVDEKTYVLCRSTSSTTKGATGEWMKALSTLQFDDDRLPNHQIETVTEVDGSSIVNDRQHNLIPNLQPLLSQLMDQTGLISALQQPWT